MQDDPQNEIRIAHALPDEPLAAPPARPTLPALARLVLYLIAWFTAYSTAQTIVVGVAIGIQFATGNLSMDTLATGQIDMIRHVGVLAIGIAGWVGLAATMLVTWPFMKFLDRRPLVTLGFEVTRKFALEWVLGILLSGLLFGSVVLAGWAMGWFQLSISASPLAALVIIIGGFLVLLPAAAVEEISMRGYVLQTVEERFGSGWALVFSSVVFALLHAMNPGLFSSWTVALGGLAGLFVAGVYMGVAYLLTRRLWLPTAVHVAWNLFEGPVFGFRVSGIETPSIFKTAVSGPDIMTGGAFGPEAGLLVSLFTLLHLALLIPVGRLLATRASAGEVPVR